MNKKFPSYHTVELAAKQGCFFCLDSLNPESIKDSDYPDGRGKYGLKCSRCNLWTLFDLSKLSIYATDS